MEMFSFLYLAVWVHVPMASIWELLTTKVLSTYSGFLMVLMEYIVSADTQPSGVVVCVVGSQPCVGSSSLKRGEINVELRLF